MKIRSLKQVLHWFFLFVGTISLLLLSLSVSTYLAYARDGYGLDVTVDDAWLAGDRLYLKLRADNPGGLDLYLGGQTGMQDTLELQEVYPVSFSRVVIQADKSDSFIFSVKISQSDMDAIIESGFADISLKLTVTVPERSALVGLTLVAADTEVRR